MNFEKTSVSSQEVFDYRELARTMADVAFWANTSQNLTEAGEPVRLTVGLVSAKTFEVLGSRPLIGRTLSADDERVNGPPVAMLGYGLWEARPSRARMTSRCSSRLSRWGAIRGVADAGAARVGLW